MHISKAEFEKIVAEGKRFKLPDLFFGTVEQFQECFFTNATYEQVVAFADSNNCVLSEYTEDEHQRWLEASNG